MEIWKETAPPPGETKTLPGRVLHVERGQLWFESTGRTTTVTTIGTGWPAKGDHKGTWFDGPLVWHLMDITDA